MMTRCEPIKIGVAVIDHYNEHEPHAFVNMLRTMADASLYDRCKDMIWLSAYAANNGCSDFHWMCDACYEECKRRNKPELYDTAHKAISGST
jgi:hypothetical protein